MMTYLLKDEKLAKARKIVLNTRTFDKAGDATDFFKEILNRYNIGERISKADATELTALLERHDELDEKIGNGIEGFEVNTPPEDVPQFSKRCFWIIRVDGSRVDFSYKHCLAPKPND